MEQERLRERQRMAGRGRDNRSGYAANQNTSFVQADDDHPQVNIDFVLYISQGLT